MKVLNSFKVEALEKPRGIDKFLFLHLAFTAAVIILHIVFFDYLPTSKLTLENMGTPNHSSNYYSTYISMALMVFFGYGFHYSSLRQFGYTAIAHSFFIAAYSMIWGNLFQGLLYYAELDGVEKQNLSIPHLINGLYTATAVLISYGAMVGRMNFQQLGIFVIGEVSYYCINNWLSEYVFDAYDTGMSMRVHVFGAIFGLAVSICSAPLEKYIEKPVNETSSYKRDIFAFLGTLILWIMWPSFNGAYAPEGTQFIVIINTVLALCSSCSIAFCLPRFFGGKFNAETVRLASLAGGIVIGSTVNIICAPWVAMILGMFAGAITFFITYYVSPFIEKKLGVRDTYSVTVLHGIIGLISSFCGMVATRVAHNSYNDGGDIWGLNYEQVFFRHPENQAVKQFISLVVSIGIALFGGILTGFMLRKRSMYIVFSNPDYTDSKEWRTPKDFPSQTSRDSESLKNQN